MKMKYWLNLTLIYHRLSQLSNAQIFLVFKISCMNDEKNKNFFFQDIKTVLICIIKIIKLSYCPILN